MYSCTEGIIDTSSEGNPASDDVMEMSPRHVRKSGLFSDIRNDFPGGSMKSINHSKHQRIESIDSSEDEGRSDGELIAYRKSRGHHRHKRPNADSTESDQCPQVSCLVCMAVRRVFSQT